MNWEADMRTHAGDEGNKPVLSVGARADPWVAAWDDARAGLSVDETVASWAGVWGGERAGLSVDEKAAPWGAR